MLNATPSPIPSSDLNAPDDPRPIPQRDENTRVADAIAAYLRDAGIDTVFGVPGGPIAPLHDALLDVPAIKTINTRHENGAMFAAAGYARMAQKPAAVLVTSGPGVMNTINGLSSAFCEGLPLILIVGEIARGNWGKKALQEGTAHHLDVVGMTRHLTKLSIQLVEPAQAHSVFQQAYLAATTGRPGPVLISVPIDVFRAPAARARVVFPVPPVVSPDLTAIQQAAAALRNSKRAMIFAGSGVRNGTGPADLLRLAELLQIPIATTPKAKGVFPESHPLSLGIFGYGGHPSSEEYLRSGIDTLLVVGTSLSDPATNNWSSLLKPTEHFIHVDIDPDVMGRHYPPTLGVISDAGQALERLGNELGDLKREKQHFGVRRFEPSQTQSPTGFITPQRALWELQQVMPPDTIYTCDIGEHLLVALHYLEIDRPDAFITMMSTGSMTSSIGAGTGAKLAASDRPVVVICGDGGFTMGLADIATAVAEKQKIVFVVLNDGKYGMVEKGHRALFGRTPDFPISESPAAVAQALGAGSVLVDGPDQILRQAPKVRLTEGPMVVEVCGLSDHNMPQPSRFDTLKQKDGK